MPINKNAYIRYRVLDKCFRDKLNHYYIEDLIECCNEKLREYSGNPSASISRRQIFDDLNFMRSSAGFNADIITKRDGRKPYYLYADKDYSIENQELNKKEIEALRNAISAISRYRGLPNYEWIDEVITSLEGRFNLNGNAGFVSFESNQNLRGIEYLPKVIDAASNQIPLTIEYRSFKSERHSKWTIHPYFVKQYNNRWFLLGRNELFKGLTNIALDRIKSIKPNKSIPFIENTSHDFEHYFDDVIGVTIPEEGVVENVVLKFDKNRFPYIQTKKIHPSQQVVNEEKCMIKITVKPNKELESLIFSFGSQVEVVYPEWMRESFKKKYELILSNYNSVQKDCTE